MSISSELEQRRAANARALAAFGQVDVGVRVVREGVGATIYTIGYERRDGDELMAALLDQGVKVLADVRERPMSRKPDFRAGALRSACEAAGVEYQAWPTLGSTADQREKLHASGDFTRFERSFRLHATRTMKPALDRLAQSVQRTPTALLCYERRHEECHRSVIADLLADQLDASIVAII